MDEQLTFIDLNTMEEIEGPGELPPGGMVTVVGSKAYYDDGSSMIVNAEFIQNQNRIMQERLAEAAEREELLSSLSNILDSIDESICTLYELSLGE